MSNPTLFDKTHETRKRALLGQVLDRLEPIFAPEEIEALRIDPVSRGIERSTHMQDTVFLSIPEAPRHKKENSHV